jgi:hypothetical protein
MQKLYDYMNNECGYSNDVNQRKWDADTMNIDYIKDYCHYINLEHKLCGTCRKNRDGVLKIIEDYPFILEILQQQDNEISKLTQIVDNQLLLLEQESKLDEFFYKDQSSILKILDRHNTQINDLCRKTNILYELYKLEK